MIQFNLLPDVKIQYIKARKLKRLISVIAALVTSFAVLVTVLLFFLVSVLQTKHLNDLSKNITTDSKKLQQTQDLDKILTIQSQLQSLPKLHADKPAASRLFSYVSQLTPTNVNMATVNVDFVTNTMTISGSADALSSVNTFVDTLKFAKYQEKDADASSQKPAFSQVVLSTFGRDPKEATYTVTTTFDPAIFDNSKETTLIVPSQVTTRSETEKPTSLFKPTETPSNSAPSTSTTTTPTTTTNNTATGTTR